MAIKDKLSAPIGGKAGQKTKVRNLPVKRSLNLAVIGEKPINPLVALPAVVLILVGAGLISKFAVIDRLAEVSRAEAKVVSMQYELDEAYERLGEFGELSEEYAHYTYSGMTTEEMERTDRVAILELIQRVVLPEALVSSWSVSSNIMTLDITRGDLQEINLLAQQLNEEPLVDFCTVTTAATTNQSSSDTGTWEVSGQIVVYLKSVEEAEESTESPTQAEQSELDKVINKTSDTVNALEQSKNRTEQIVAEEVGP